MNFELLTPATVRVVNANPRTEKHGTDNVPAIDLKLRMETSNTMLQLFHPELLRALYYSSEEARAQADVEGVQPILPNRVFEKLLPLKWRDEGTGYVLTIDHGMGGKSDLVLADCSVDHFQIEPKEGGTVVLTWRLQSNHVNDRELGKLCTMIDSDVLATLRAPEVEAPEPQQRIDDPPTTTTVTTKRRRRPAGREAGEIFAGQHGAGA